MKSMPSSDIVATTHAPGKHHLMEDVDVGTASRMASETIRQHRTHPDAVLSFESWAISRVAAGFNGVVWRARGDGVADLAVKLSVVDDRTRGRHEFASTRRLVESGLDVAPHPFAIVEDGDLTALVSSWCLGAPLVEPPPSDSPLWETIVDRYIDIHRVPHAGLPTAVLGASVHQYLAAAQEYAERAQRRRFASLLEEVRRRLSEPLPDYRAAALIHGDVSIANTLVEREQIRLVDWEYAGVGDPCADLASLTTSPAHLDLPVDISEDLIHRHAAALGSEILVERTHAFVLASLLLWCARTGTRSRYSSVNGSSANPRFDVTARTDHYRDRLAEAMSVDRRQIDRALAVDE
jgi:aminoglycoside phosphotransferase (APT) family kinase protein